MTAFLYVPGQGEFLAERWLAQQPPEESVFLLSAPQAQSETQALRQRHASVRGLVPLDGTADTARQIEGLLAGINTPRIVLPVSLDMRPLRYRPGVLLPHVTPHYALLKSLWALGFREAVFQGLDGAHVLPMPHLLEDFAGRHRGRRCFVVGNGPSLNEIDMGRLKDEITLGSNRCFLGFERWGFPFTYWGISDTFQIQEYAREYEASVPAEVTKFFPFEYSPLLRFEAACPLNLQLCREAAHGFSDQPGTLYAGHTVTHMLLQLAAVMGCDPIILIGSDHRYDVKAPSWPRKTIRRAHRFLQRRFRDTAPYRMGEAAFLEWRKSRASAAADRGGFWDVTDPSKPTHFDSRYTAQTGRKFRLPEPELAEQDFLCALRWAQARGVRILNATPNSALEVFTKVPYDELF